MELSIQERLKDLRVERGLTLEQLAEQTHLSKSALGSYEAEDFKDISHYALIKLAKFYGVTTDYLLGLSQTKNHSNADLADLRFAALHNGEIDGAENNWPSYEAMGHYEVAPYFLKDEHTRVPEVQLASPAVMEKLAALDERYPEIIRLCARESAKVERRLWAQQEAESESDLRAAGIEVTELDEEEKARFRAAVQPMYDRFAQQGELIARIRQA